MDGAIVVRAHGGPEVLEWTRSDPGQPGPGEVLIRHTAVGLNYIDVYHRDGLYPLELPFTPGVEGAGHVEAVGEGVDDVEATAWAVAGSAAKRTKTVTAIAENNATRRGVIARNRSRRTVRSRRCPRSASNTRRRLPLLPGRG